MILALTILGLIGIPFYDMIFRIFPDVHVMAIDTRSQREMFAVILALAIGLSALYHGTKPFKNKWLFLFVLLQLVSVNLIPHIPMVINGIHNSVFWVWNPLFQVVCYLLMLVAIAGMEWDKIKVDKILSVMYWCGLAMACYVILQTYGFDPFNIVKGVSLIGSQKFPERVGALGQPTLVSPYIAMLVPMALYLKKYIFAIFMIIAVFLTQSQMAIGALIIGLVAYTCLNKPKLSFAIIPLFIGTGVYLFFNKLITIGDSGRLGVWKIAWGEIMATKINRYEGLDFSFFGHGLGGFSYLSEALEQSKFSNLHNEYFSILYGCGIFGLILFIMAGIYFLGEFSKKYRKSRDHSRKQMAALFCSFLIISLCAIGAFVFHLGVYCFYTILVVGLMSNETINGGGKCLES